MTKAVIMAGGFGTRLRPLTMNLPKPMVPIANVPMMEHIVKLLKNHGINQAVSLLYYHPDIVTSYFEDGAKFGIDMVYKIAEEDYGTAGSVKNAYEYLDERFIIISGDVLTDFELTDALKFHEAKGSKATILLTRVKKPLQYGIVITDDEGRITRFLEKPSWGQVFSDTINTGIYILEPEALDLIPYKQEFDFSQDLFPRMLKEGMPLYGYIAEGYWRDVGNLSEYLNGQRDALTGELNLEHKGVVVDNYTAGYNTKIAPSAKLSGSNVIGNNSEIGEHSELNNCVIGGNCKIGAGVKMNNVTIWNNCDIGDFVEMTNDVICNNCKIGDSTNVLENVFIADGCIIGKNAQLYNNIKLWPEKHVQDKATLSSSLVQEEKWLRELFTGARITGSTNVEINPEFGAKLGAAIGMTLGRNIQVLGSRDPDKVSRLMKRSISAGLASVGVDVNDLQTVSIPQTRQELLTGRYSGGFHVRKSPRKRNHTDIIIFNKDGRDISISRTKKIERFFFGEDIKRAQGEEIGTIRYPERTHEIYLNRFMESLDIDVIYNRGFKLLMDYSFGLASTIFPSILGKMNVEALSINDFVDATRFHPDPTMEKPETDDTGKIMRSLAYELGFRLEAGAEKISLIDERGVWYSPNRLLTMLTKLFLETHRDREPYKIAVSITARNEIEKIVKNYNVEVVRIKNTHMDMMEATLDKEYLFVGGSYGGYIFTDFLFAADGMFSVGKILEMLAKTGYKISQLDEELPRRYQYQTTVDCPWDMKGQVMRQAMEYSEDYERQLVEGVKMFFDNNSVLLMPSQEYGLFSVIGESDKYDTAVSIAKKYSAMLTQWIET